MAHRSLALDGWVAGVPGAGPLLTTAIALALASWAAVALTPAGPGFAAAVALAFAPVAAGILLGLPRLHPHRRFGAANALTLLRAALACLAAGLVVQPQTLAGAGVLAWLPLAGAVAALASDGVDGWCARRQGLASAFGARFDMEVDAWLILMLSAVAVTQGAAPVWAIGIGLLRYLYLLAGWLAPSLARPLPYSLRRRAICGLQVAALGAILAPPLAGAPASWIAGAGLAALAISFGRDARWCLRAPTGDHARP